MPLCEHDSPTIRHVAFMVMQFLVEPGTTLEFETETMEFIATPAETGDRYSVRMTVTPQVTRTRT